MLTGRKQGLQERFFIKLESIDHYTLNASQNMNILSLVSQLSNLGCFLVKLSTTYKTVKKDLIFI